MKKLKQVEYSIGTVKVLPDDYNRLSIVAQKLNRCDIEISKIQALRDLNESDNDTEGDFHFTKESQSDLTTWEQERSAQWTVYVNDVLPDTFRRLNERSIFCQMTSYYVENLYSKKETNAGVVVEASSYVSDLAKFGRGVSIFCTILGTLAAGISVFFGVKDYRNNTLFIKPTFHYALIIVVWSFAIAYLYNALFLYWMRSGANDLMQEKSPSLLDKDHTIASTVHQTRHSSGDRSKDSRFTSYKLTYSDED